MRKTLTILAACLALPATAGTFGPFDELIVFGDSLSDSGNVAAARGDAFPFFIYPNGQFTNGDAWTTQLGLTPSLTGGTNYAYGDARAADNMDGTPDLLAQIGQFSDNGGPSGTNSLAVIWSGGNDFRDLSPTVDQAGLTTFITSIAGTIALGAKALHAEGLRDLAIFGLPDFGALPQYAGDPLGAGQASFVSSLLNEAISNTAMALDIGLPGTNVEFFDLDAVFQDVLAEVPLDNQRLRCIDSPFECAANPTSYLFYDDIHPTEWVHEALATNFEENVLQPVPLPAGGMLLLSGFAGFALWGKRRKSLT